jgi:methyl-accepting chemotaxis protein
VVAEEVQRLAESSRQATGTIAQLVQNIQADTSETIFTMNRLISQVVDQSAQAQKAGEQMSFSQGATEQLVRLVQQIANFSQQQAELSDSLRESIMKLDTDAQETTAAIEQQSSASLVLMQYSQDLADAVNQFRLPEQAEQAEQ